MFSDIPDKCKVSLQYVILCEFSYKKNTLSHNHRNDIRTVSLPNEYFHDVSDLKNRKSVFYILGTGKASRQYGFLNELLKRSTERNVFYILDTCRIALRYGFLHDLLNWKS